jgi:hypothetical protein
LPNILEGKMSVLSGIGLMTVMIDTMIDWTWLFVSFVWGGLCGFLLKLYFDEMDDRGR